MNDQITTRSAHPARMMRVSEAVSLPVAPLAMPKQVLTRNQGIARRAVNTVFLMIESLKHSFRRAG